MTNWHIQRPGRFINEPDGYAGLTVVTGINAVKMLMAFGYKIELLVCQVRNIPLI
jgi:hypothetical protein